MAGAIPAEEASGTLSESITHSYICRIQVVSTTRGSAFSSAISPAHACPARGSPAQLIDFRYVSKTARVAIDRMYELFRLGSSS